MRIGDLAEQTRVPIKTIRYYEDIGVLPIPDRTPSGYRDYDRDATDRLQFVRAAQRAGLTLAEIRSVFELRDRGEAPCGHVADLIDRKLAEMDQRMNALRQTKRELARLGERAKRLDPVECGPDAICHIIVGA